MNVVNLTRFNNVPEKVQLTQTSALTLESSRLLWTPLTLTIQNDQLVKNNNNHFDYATTHKTLL